MKLLVIGISGATCSGKTTLAGLLSQCFKAEKFNQDDFYHPEDHPAHVKVPGFNHFNWELETAFDNAKLFKAIKEAKKAAAGKNFEISSLRRALDSSQGLITSKAELSPVALELFKSAENLPVVLLEGITILESGPLRNLCDLRLFLTLDEATCKKRRLLRAYDPPDPPGYFEAAVWPSYEANLQRLQGYSTVHYIDGRNPLEANFITAARLILETLENGQ